jgi:hypothetical protein
LISRVADFGQVDRFLGPLVSWNDAAVDLPLSPIHPAAGQLVAGLKSPDMLLAVSGGLGVQRPDDLCAVAPVAGAMRHSGFRAAETVG